jgi:SAM-dependent methyltransferase
MVSRERTQANNDAGITGAVAHTAGSGAHSVGMDPDSLSAKSFEFVRACQLGPNDPIIAVGDLDPHFLAALVRAGHRDLTVLHPSMEALEGLREALGDLESEVMLTEADPLQFEPNRRYALWNDRRFFHRLTHPDDRQRYVEIVHEALRPEGHLIISTFGPEGPAEDSGVPVERYSAARLAAELGRQFELVEDGFELHPAVAGGQHQLLHSRFRRRTPHWPSEPRNGAVR